MELNLGGLNISISKRTEPIIEIREGNVQEQNDVEAIVNAANRHLRPGTGVCGAIYSAAGYEKLNDNINAAYPNGCPTGDAIATPAFDLEAIGIKTIIHAVGPKYFDYPAEIAARRLRTTYQSIFLLCRKLGIKSVAIPAISTGVYQYPMPEAAYIAVEEAREAQQFYPELKIVFVVWPEKIQAFKDAIDGTVGNDSVQNTDPHTVAELDKVLDSTVADTTAEGFGTGERGDGF